MITDERFERIRQFLSTDWLMRDGESALDYARELFREVDAQRRSNVRQESDTFVAYLEASRYGANADGIAHVALTTDYSAVASARLMAITNVDLDALRVSLLGEPSGANPFANMSTRARFKLTLERIEDRIDE